MTRYIYRIALGEETPPNFNVGDSAARYSLAHWEKEQHAEPACYRYDAIQSILLGRPMALSTESLARFPQGGTCLVESPAKGWTVSFIRALPHYCSISKTAQFTKDKNLPEAP